MNNSLKQPRRCAGFTPTRAFAHRPKVRRNAQRLGALQADQSLQLSPWSHVATVSHKVDAERVNWKGYLYAESDTAVRLVKRRG